MASAHPTSLELIDYAYGWLSPARMKAIATHVAHCPFCRADAVVRQDYLETLADTLPTTAASTGPSAVAQVQRWLATLVTRPSLALAGASEDESPHLYEVNGIQIALQIVPSADASPRTLMGLITGAETQVEYAQLRHIDQPTELARAEVDSAGQFLITIPQSDHYSLVLVTQEQEIVIPNLDL